MRVAICLHLLEYRACARVFREWEGRKTFRFTTYE